MPWNRKELKSNAKDIIKKNRINIVIVCFVIAIIAGGYTESTAVFKVNDDLLKTLPSLPASISNIVDSVQSTQDMALSEINKRTEPFVKNITVFEKISKKFNIRNATDGVIASLIGNISGSNSILVGVLNSLNAIIFSGKFLEGTIIAIATVITVIFWIFVQNILRVGECRFFLETKNYSKSNVKRLTFIYRVKKTFHIAGIMLLRSVYNFLWFFTIVGGFIKYYSYKMIPYILAENPDISRRDAFILSAEMMKGNKWNAFKLDMSFFFWHMLSAVSFGVVGFLYVNPYLGATRVELYYALREQVIEECYELSELLNDKYLLYPPEEDMKEYPMELFSIPEKRQRDWMTFKYDRKYSLTSLVFLFFSACFIGWIWEVFLHLLSSGTFVNRGTLYGPWLPIYGVGSVMMVVLLKPLVKKPPAFFLGALITCGMLEYFSSWILEKIYGQRWWDYTDFFLNINGRVCLEGLLFFAVGGVLVVYVIAPYVDDIAKRIPKAAKNSIALLLVLVFSVDVIVSYIKPNQGDWITSPPPEASKQVEKKK